MFEEPGNKHRLHLAGRGAIWGLTQRMVKVKAPRLFAPCMVKALTLSLMQLYTVSLLDRPWLVNTHIFQSPHPQSVAQVVC